MADAEERLGERADEDPAAKNSQARRRTGADMNAAGRLGDPQGSEERPAPGGRQTAAEYCGKVQEWMWQYYWGCMNWQSWAAMSAYAFPPCSLSPPANPNGSAPPWGGGGGPSPADVRSWYSSHFPLAAPPYFPVTPAGHAAAGAQAGQLTAGDRPVLQQNGNAPQPGREYTIPSPLHRFIAEMVDFFILFFIKATIVLSIMHFSGMKDISKFAMHFIVEEIDEDTSMEELQKMMVVALIYRVLVCFYEIICIWGAGGATPGKFLLGLRVVTCDTSVLVRPNRVFVVPASNVTLSASTVRALNKNFSIAFFFPAFITLLFFQHNRTVYDIVAGTIVVKRSGAR
ncbi:protein FAM8A1 [Lepisosteus oculatus]|uniref:protein FAM8A1 n=1 Tax=Lepisosteus oculatus TaxID=7918 RepID=UPI0035F52A65